MKLEHPNINWQENIPVSSQYGDVYFSKEGGVEETQYVFLKQNHMQERFANLKQDEAFIIAETGFGTGLNALVTMQCFLDTAPSHARLLFISTELHPLRQADLQRACQSLPASLKPYAEPLLRQWPEAVESFQLLRMHERIDLLLLLGDAAGHFSQLESCVDAWFLDGFTPTQNPALWSDALFAQMARLSHNHTSFSTYSASGQVRRGLEKHGFIVEKCAGFGRKRHMLHGYFRGERHKPAADVRPVYIAGAGIAGASVAHSFAMRGKPVRIYDPLPPATQSSGNLAAILYPFFAIEARDPGLQYYLHGLLGARRVYDALIETYPFIRHAWCGMLRLPKAPEEAERLAKMAVVLNLPESILCHVSAAEASKIAGIPMEEDALFVPLSGWVSLPDIVQAMLGHTLVTYVPQAFSAPHDKACVIYATGTHALPETAWLPLIPTKGQITYAKPATPLACVLCHNGFVTPAINGRHHLGATFEIGVQNTDIVPSQLGENVDVSQRFFADEGIEASDGWAGVRAITKNRMPYIGRLPNPLKQQSDAHAYVSLGHASRGSLSAPLAGEMIVLHYLTGTHILPRHMHRHVMPERALPV